MICIDAEQLQDGLYNIKDGKIYKYKAKGGTVRTYELRNIVRCGECRYWHSGECWGIPYRGDYDTSIDTKADDFCSYGCREEERYVETD